MNERIRELSKEAWAWAEQQEYTDPAKEFSDILEQKFAELIVKACADTAYESLYEDKIFDDSPYNIRCHVMDAIKKHFGVK